MTVYNASGQRLATFSNGIFFKASGQRVGTFNATTISNQMGQRFGKKSGGNYTL